MFSSTLWIIYGELQNVHNERNKKRLKTFDENWYFYVLFLKNIYLFLSVEKCCHGVENTNHKKWKPYKNA